MATAGTVSGGTYVMAAADQWGVRAFALKPATGQQYSRSATQSLLISLSATGVFSPLSSPATYYPGGYNLYGSTKFVGGSLSQLQADDSVYMTCRSYVSASSTTAKTNAFIAYRDSTISLNTPKERTWTGVSATWNSQAEMGTAGSPVRFTRVAYCPLEQRSFEKI
ncbi:MAG: hypothetical protein CEN91_511 [Candidatus Berkelbacteria bacterium Licking1014_85]|uniref:Uncharacterized protein n=1 Tax=Candidatus Berkelbacteria bacterium Licking1014_85 TaxID=2017148 RepID=A0A554LHA4_9BACT|nr:MAG: hypothetical protein CEN91_511 [Candidatus Berkelbacteria bacterium Licking1014_85]